MSFFFQKINFIHFIIILFFLPYFLKKLYKEKLFLKTINETLISIFFNSCSEPELNLKFVQAEEELLADNGGEAPVMPKFEVKDLESLDGKYDTVVCLDVLIHYPQSKADGMIAHLASLAENRLILSFAPKTFYYDLLKRVGELFPGPSKATRAYLHAEADVERALQKVGWKIRKRGLITSQFYFARLVEAVPA